MLVEVRPIYREKWFGDPEKGKLFVRPRTIRAAVDVLKGKYVVDIPEERLKELEEKTGYDLSLTFIPGKPHPFWDDKPGQVVLPYATKMFDTSNPLDEIRVGILKGSHYVANSLAEYEEGLAPDAEFVIYDEMEEMQEKIKRTKAKQQAFQKLMKLGKREKKNIAEILLNINLSEQSDEFIEGKLFDYIENGGHEEFLKVANRDKEDINIHALIIEALYSGVLHKKGQSIYFMSERLGFDIDSAIKYLKNPDNESIKIRIMEKLS